MIQVSIGNTLYTKLSVVSFSPQTDPMSNELQINVCVVNIKTDDTIAIGSVFQLVESVSSTVLAKYYVTDTYKTSDGFVRVEAKSPLIYLDRDILEPVMYSNEPASDVIDACFSNTETKLGYTIHNVSSSITDTITGYLPKQSARERLQWVCFTVGAIVSTEFGSVVDISPIDLTSALIPDSKTFWKPILNYKDEVTAIKVKYYAFTEGIPTAVDTWVKIDDSGYTRYYIETEDEETSVNQSVQSNVRENVISFEGITIIDQSKVNQILARLSSYYFNRIEVDASILNIYTYKPADRVSINNGEMLVNGYIKSSEYVFGNNAKTRVLIQQYSDVEFYTFTINFSNDEIAIQSIVSILPEGYVYDYDVTLMDLYGMNLLGKMARYILLPPDSSHIHVVIPDHDSSVSVEMTSALQYITQDDNLDVWIVDEATLSQGVLSIV